MLTTKQQKSILSPKRLEAGHMKKNQAEKIIFDKYGEQGLKVYELINGKTQVTEILAKTGIEKPKLVEILDFMDAEGIIRLDYPK